MDTFTVQQVTPVVKRNSQAGGLFPGRRVAVAAPPSQVKALWALARADVPGAVEEFVAGNETAKAILGEGRRYLVAGDVLGGEDLRLTALGALANGFWSVWSDVSQSVWPQLGEEGIA